MSVDAENGRPEGTLVNQNEKPLLKKAGNVINRIRSLGRKNPLEALKFVSSVRSKTTTQEGLKDEASDSEAEIFKKAQAELLEREVAKLEKSPDIREWAQPQDQTTRYMHATGVVENAEEVVEKGLNARESIFYSAHELPNDYQGNLEYLVRRWGGLRFVTTIRLPDLKPELQQRLDELNEHYGRNRKDEVFLEPLPSEEVREYGGYRYRIPSKYVEGILDTASGINFKNHEFSPEITEEEYRDIEQRLAKLK